MLWPRVKIDLSNGSIVVPFDPNTLAIIEREVGLSSMEFAQKFAGGSKAPVFDLGMKIILGAIVSVHPEYTAKLLGERILPGTFLTIFQAVADAWVQGVAMAAGPVVEATEANPTTAGEGSPSST